MAISIGEIFAHSEYVPQLSAGNPLLHVGARPIKHHGTLPMDKILATRVHCLKLALEG